MSLTFIKYLKHSGTILLFICLLIVLFWDFTAEAPAEDGKIHLSYWHLVGQKEVELYSVKLFNEIQDSIEVHPTAIPWQEYEKKILTAILSGNPPDVFNHFAPVVKLASRMALIPLDDFIERDQFDTTIFFPALWTEMRYAGHLFAVPVRTASYGFFINKSLFREAGLNPENPPATWAEVKRLAKKFVKYGDDGQIVRMGFIPKYSNLPLQGDLMVPLLMAWQLGAQFLVDGGTRVSLNNPELMESLQWVIDYFAAYSLEEVTALQAGFGYADQQAFLSEKVAMMILDNTFMENIALHNPDLDYGVAPIPSFPNTHSSSMSGSWWLAIPRGSRYPEAAWDFIKFVSDKEVQLQEIAHMEENLFPANKFAANDSSFVNSDSNMIVFVNQMEYSHSPVVVPMAHEVFWREFYNAIESAVRGTKSPQEALIQAENLIQIELDRASAYDAYVRKKMNFEGLRSF